MSPPHLTFACELGAAELQALFAEPSLFEDLLEQRASVALGLLDLSPARAAVVRRLNEAGIPVVAWLLLDKEQGYWFNVDNAPQAIARYGAWKAWTAEQGLQWAGVGIDIEPNIGEMQQLLSDARWQLLPRLLGRAFDGERLRRAQGAYSRLVAQIRADGYPVQSYQFPIIADERKAGSTLLQRLFGVLDVPADRETLMLYTSFVPAAGPGLLWSYGPDAEVIGIGITGGGVDLEVEPAPLSWDEFSRDLRLARRLGDEVFVFSLEGCVQQGFLERMKALDWDQPIAIPAKSARQVDTVRKLFQAILWAGAHPMLVLGSLAALMWWISRLRSGSKSRTRT